MRKIYPSDVTHEQFKRIESILTSARKTTKPRTVDLYEVFCAVLYVLKTGCQWRALPHEFPKWRSVHEYFSIWSEKEKDKGSILEQVLKRNRWRGAYEQWSQRENKYDHRGRSKC